MRRRRTKRFHWQWRPEVSGRKYLLVTRAKKRIARVTLLVQRKADRSSSDDPQNCLASFLNRAGLLVAAIAILVLHSGCMTAGEQLKESATSKLQKGQNLAEVRNIFGSPKRTETGANGKRLDFYQISYLRKVRGPKQAFVLRTLSVLYDESGQVEDFVRSVGELPIRETPMGWEAGIELDEARVRGIQRETHSRNDMIFTFGPPTALGLDRNGDALLAWHFLRGNGGFFNSGYELLAIFDSSDRVKDFLWREMQR
jgi:hypothetical protein